MTLPDDVMEKMVEAGARAYCGYSVPCPGKACGQCIRKAREILAAALAHCSAQGGAELICWYKNHRGEERYRHIRPISFRHGVSEWHPERQWLMLADDLENGERREFAMKDISSVVGGTIITATPSPIRDAEIESLTAEVARLRAALVEIERAGWKEGLGAEHAVAAHYEVRKIARRAIGQTMDT